MASVLARITSAQRRDAADALDDLRAVLAPAGVVLPSLGVDWRACRLTGTFLVELGAAGPETVRRLVDLLRRGLLHERQEAQAVERA